MTSALPPRLKRALVRAAAAVVVTGSILALPSAVSAQLVRIGASRGVAEPGPSMRGTDTAYDPARDLYLAVTGNGGIYAAFVNAAGAPITGAFPVMDGSLGWGHFPRVEYSPDIWGGQGGFLVTWHHNVGNVNCVFGRIVSAAVPGGLASGDLPDFGRSGGRKLVGNRASHGVLANQPPISGGVAHSSLWRKWAPHRFERDLAERRRATSPACSRYRAAEIRRSRGIRRPTNSD